MKGLFVIYVECLEQEIQITENILSQIKHRSTLQVKSSNAFINNWSIETKLDHTDMSFTARGDYNDQQKMTGNFLFGGADNKMVVTLTGALVNLTLNGEYFDRDSGKTFR